VGVGISPSDNHSVCPDARCFRHGFLCNSIKHEEPTLWTLEMPPGQLRLSHNEKEEVSLQELEWVRGTLVGGEVLARDPAFNRAFSTFDSVRWFALATECACHVVGSS